MPINGWVGGVGKKLDNFLIKIVVLKSDTLNQKEQEMDDTILVANQATTPKKNVGSL